jgi:hypothetical protein
MPEHQPTAKTHDPRILGRWTSEDGAEFDFEENGEGFLWQEWPGPFLWWTENEEVVLRFVVGRRTLDAFFERAARFLMLDVLKLKDRSLLRWKIASVSADVLSLKSEAGAVSPTWELRRVSP